MALDFKNLLQDKFYINKAYLTACALTAYSSLFNVSYVDKSQQELIGEVTELRTVASKAGSAGAQGNAVGTQVAVITFNQPVIKYDTYYWLGTQTYIQILERFRQDSDVAGVVMVMDTGGGQVYGTPEYYDYVTEFVQDKPLVVYAGGLLCSGGYYMAAPASRIIANKRADAIGSIGAYGTIVDYDGIIKHFGGAVHTVYSDHSTEKNEAVRKVLEGDYTLYIKEELNPIVESFQADMRAVRPQIDEKAFKGGTWSGPEALNLGLVDELGTIQTAITAVYELAQGKSNSNNSKQSKKRMSKTKTLPNVQKALGLSGPVKIATKLSGATGFFVSVAQLDALEASIKAGNDAVTAANGQVTEANNKVTALDTAVNNAIKTAKLSDDVEADATTESKITLLGSKVAEYGKKPGAAPATPKADTDPVLEGEDDQDKSNSLYNSLLS